MYRSHVLVCGGTGCTSSGCQEIMKTLQAELEKNGLTEEVAIVQTGCHGLCALGPIMIVYPEATFYSMVKPEYVPEIVTEHLLKGRVVKKYVYEDTVQEEGLKPLHETDFYKKQHRIALRNCGVINPENIDEYIAFDGYEGTVTEVNFRSTTIKTIQGFEVNNRAVRHTDFLSRWEIVRRTASFLFSCKKFG